MGLADYRKIIFHCGIHKTGSSYLQSVLRRNAAELATLGIHYPGFITPNLDAIHEGNHSILATQYKGEEDLDAYFSSRIHLDSDLPTLLISGEEFSREQVLIPLLPPLMRLKGAAELVFVVYLRRFDHLLEGVYAESVKRSLKGDVDKASYQLNYPVFLGPMVEAVGAANVILRPYNRAQWPNGSLGEDFCAAIGHEGLWQRFSGIPENKNVSYPRAQTFLLSRLAQRQAKQDLMAFFAERPLTVPPDPDKFFMSPERRRTLNLNHHKTVQPFFDEHGYPDLREFLDLDSFPDRDSWAPFVPPWAELHDYLAAFIDWQHARAAG